MDLAFVIENDDPAFEGTRVISDPYVLLAPAGSELAQSDRPIRPREIAALPLIAYRNAAEGAEPYLRSRGARARDRLSLGRGRHRPGARRRGHRLHRGAAPRRGREPRRHGARGHGDPTAPDPGRVAHRPHTHPGGPRVRRDRHRARGRDRRGLRSGRDEPHDETHETTPMRLLTVVGNRPQFIKSAPLSVALREAGIDEVVVHSGQHWDPSLSTVFYEELGLAEPDIALDLRTSDVATIEAALRKVVADVQPDAVLIYGDTNSTLAGCRAGDGVPVAHVEAGLRSGDSDDAGGAQPDRGRRALHLPFHSGRALGRDVAQRGRRGRDPRRRRRDGRRRGPVCAARARTLGDPHGPRPRARRLRARDGSSGGERAARAPNANRGGARPLAASGRAARAPPNEERAGRAGDRGAVVDRRDRAARLPRPRPPSHPRRR